MVTHPSALGGCGVLASKRRVERFKLSDVQPLPWNRPVATFMAKGKFYYIDVYRCAISC